MMYLDIWGTVYMLAYRLHASHTCGTGRKPERESDLYTRCGMCMHDTNAEFTEKLKEDVSESLQFMKRMALLQS
jgi:hypothetical protein